MERRSFAPAAVACLLSLLAITSVALAADRVHFPADRLLLDVRQAGWQYLARDPLWASRASFGRSDAELKRDADRAKTEYGTIATADGWKPITLGRRFDNSGHAELNDKITWLRLKFDVPAGLRGYRLGFFCTAVDDSADIFMNGVHLGRRVYHWGTRVAEPVNVDLTPQVRFGGENLLVVRVNDSAQARGGGVLGHVLLYRTVPYERTAKGGINVSAHGQSNYGVVLHVADALLARGQQVGFTADELRAMEMPPYLLRDDELVLVFPSQLAKAAGPHRVQLDQVCPTRDDRPLAVGWAPLPGRVGRYELLAIPVQLAARYENPFDVRQVNVLAEIETPSGKTEQVRAFFWQDFTSVAIGEVEEILLPKRNVPWRVYYRPRELGVHKLHLLAQDQTGVRRTPDQKFEVVESGRKGFLRVSKNDPRFFEFDNGESYFGIGPSGWFRDANYIFGGNPRWVSTRRLDDYYRRKARAGSNYDYCLAEFFGRLYTQGGYIDQHVAWKCEHRVRTLEELGIYWVTCYDDLCRSVIYGLDTLPYSKAQGGPCGTIEELYVNHRSLEMQHDHLRYFVARMSDSPALLLWAIGDEGQAGSRYSPLMVRSWIKGLQNFVRTIDVYGHPHVMGEGPRSVAEGTDAVIIPDWYFHRDIDAVSLTLELMKTYDRFNCPLVNPEGGMVEWTKPADRYGPKHALYYLSGERWQFPEAISFHNHLWISLFQKNAVGGTEWMGAFIDRKNELYHAGAIRDYLAGESLTRPRWEIVAPAVSHPDLRGFVLQSDAKSLAWVQNRFYTWLEAGHRGNKPPVVRGASIDVPVRSDGTFRVELWDTRSGKVISATDLRAASKKVTCPLPPVDKDVALKLIKQ